MGPFLVRAAWRKLWILVAVAVISFGVVHLAPGDPSQIDPLNPRFTREQLARYRAAFDLDRPLPVQFARFYWKLATGELRSFKDNQPVLPRIAGRVAASLPLFMVGTLLVWCYAFPLGVVAAVRRGSWLDRVTTVTAFALISLPGFFLADRAIVWVIDTLHVDVFGRETFGRQAGTPLLALMDRLWHLVLPSALTATAGVAVLSRYVRAQVLEVVGADFVRTARAKGLPENRVLYHHALANALLPFVTMFGLLLPGLVGGSVIIETLFAWPGIGRLGYEAILNRDYPVVIAIGFFASVLTLVGTLVSDILAMLVDPRIRL
jgi:peptide/nickel transport system permease protein